MPAIRKILAQSKPPAGSRTNVLKVATGDRMEVDTVVVTNHGAADTFELSLAPSGADHSAEQFSHVGVSVGVGDTFIVAPPASVPLNSGDVVRFKSAGGALSVQLWGVHIPALT